MSHDSDDSEQDWRSLYLAEDEEGGAADTQPTHSGHHHQSGASQYQHHHHSHAGPHQTQAAPTVGPANDSFGFGDGEDDEHEQDVSHVLSPTDGYFRASEVPFSSSSSYLSPLSPTTRYSPLSSQVPHVPDVWVQDPSLNQQPQGRSSSEADSKAREAQSSDQSNPARWSHSTQLPYSDLFHGSAFAGGSSTTQPLNNISIDRAPPSAATTITTPRSHSSLGPLTSTTTATTTTTPPPSSRPYYPTQYRHSGFTRGGLHSHIPLEAPPAYSPSSNSSGSPVSATSALLPGNPQPGPGAGPSSHNNYQTFGRHSVAINIMGRDESQGLLSRDPEDMGGHSDDEYEHVTTVWHRRVRRRFHSRSCKGVLLALVLGAITIGFLLSTFNAVRNIGVKPKIPSEKIEQPPEDFTPIDEDMDFPAASNCKAAQTESTLRYTYKADAGRSLSLKETLEQNMDRPDETNVRVFGQVFFRKADEASITVETKASDDRIVVKQEYDPDAQSLELTVPRTVPWDNRHEPWPCLTIRVTVDVPDTGVLDDLSVSTVHLDVLLLDSLSVAIRNRAVIHTVVGRVVAASNGLEIDPDQLIRDGAPESFRFDSRTIAVKSVSAPILGSWPLYDYLGLETVSGDIRVGVEPKPVDKDRPREASLFVKSTSGHVEFWEPVHKSRQILLQQQQQLQQLGGDDGSGSKAAAPEQLIPPRNYSVNAHTTSGPIKGAVAFTSSATFHSTSGTMAVDLLPVLPAAFAAMTDLHPEEKKSTLHTSSTSGTTAIRVLEPMWFESEEGTYSTAPTDLIAAPKVPSQPKVPKAPSWPNPDRGVFVPIGGGDPYRIPGVDPSVLIPPGLPKDVLDNILRPPVKTYRDQDQDQSKKRARSESVARFLRILGARHDTTSADLGLRYPGSWEGDIDVSSMAGSIAVTGEGVKIIRSGGDWPGVNKRVVARKGELAEGTGSAVVVRTMSGRVGVHVGEGSG